MSSIISMTKAQPRFGTWGMTVTNKTDKRGYDNQHVRQRSHCALSLVGGKRRSKQSGSQGIHMTDDNSVSSCLYFHVAGTRFGCDDENENVNEIRIRAFFSQKKRPFLSFSEA